MRATATCVEPDQVNAFLRSMDDMRSKLIAHRDDKRFSAAVYAIRSNIHAFAITALLLLCVSFIDATVWPSFAHVGPSFVRVGQSIPVSP